MTLKELAMKYRTDKCKEVMGKYWPSHGHNYIPTYEKLFDEKRDNVKRLLEIGIDDGASLRMWHDYFHNAEIIGLDIDGNKLINNGRITSYQCDQGNTHQLNLVKEAIDPCDVIIDDGSHDIAHQILGANILADKLVPGGYYIVEDVQPHPGSHKRIIDEVKWPWEKTLIKVGILGDDVLMVMQRPE